MTEAKVLVFKDKKGMWCWHLRSSNGKILAHGESHTRARDARRAAENVSEKMLMAPIEVQEE